MKTIKTKQGSIQYLGVKGRVAWLRAEHPDAHGQVTPGDILNALMALPTAVTAGR